MVVLHHVLQLPAALGWFLSCVGALTIVVTAIGLLCWQSAWSMRATTMCFQSVDEVRQAWRTMLGCKPPQATSFDRRIGDRRQRNVSVVKERRSGSDRRGSFHLAAG